MKYTYYVTVLVVRPRGADYELLLARRATGKYMGGTWALISGGLEPNETAWEGALRELNEETGLAPEEFFRLSTMTGFYRADDDSLNVAPMFCAIVKEGARVKINAEHTEFTWIDVAEAEHTLLWPKDKEALAEVRNAILTPSQVKEHLRIPLPDGEGKDV